MIPPEFWFDAFRDFGLLIAGSSFTLLGTWLSNIAARKREDTAREQAEVDARASRGRAALETAQQSIVGLYLEARAQIDRGERSRVKFDAGEVFAAECRVYLIANPKLREVVTRALGALRGLGPAISVGLLDGNPADLQAQVLFSSIQIISAELRGDTLPPRHFDIAKKTGDATEQAWTDAIADQTARKVTSAS